jgi:hypothetical protein
MVLEISITGFPGPLQKKTYSFILASIKAFQSCVLIGEGYQHTALKCPLLFFPLSDDNQVAGDYNVLLDLEGEANG